MKDLEFQRKLGQRIRAAREAADMSQMDVTLCTGMSVSHYWKIENGRLDPRVSTLVELAQLFGVTVNDFLK